METKYKREYMCLACQMLTCEEDLVYTYQKETDTTLATCECGSVDFNVIRVVK